MIKNQVFKHSNIFFIVFSLGFMSGLPASLFTTSLQAWFAQSGYSILFVSSLSLLKLPILFRFVLAPLVDKYYISALGRRKSWMLLTQICLFILIECIALFKPQQAQYIILMLSGLLVLASCLQDIVIDAHRIEFLPRHFYGYGAVCAIYAYRLALLVSGGLALIIAQILGFQLTYALLGIFFIFGGLVVFWSKEPQLKISPQEISKGPIGDFLQQPHLGCLIGMVICIKFGEVFVSNTSPMMIPFMLQGLGLSLVKIAYINKIFGLISQLIGSALAAVLIARIALMRLLFIFGVMQILSNLMFWWVSLHHAVEWTLWVTVAFENIATGLSSTVLIAFLMGLVNLKYTALQFSIWVTIALIPGLLAGPLGGFVSEYFGWPSLFLLSSLMTSIFIVFWYQLKQNPNLGLPREVMSEGVSSS